MAMNRRYHRAVWPCMEALYQSVYAQVFATKWSGLSNYPLATRMALAREEAENAAAAAVSGFSFSTQDKAVAVFDASAFARAQPSPTAEAPAAAPAPP